MAIFHITSTTLKTFPQLRNLTSIKRSFTTERIIYNKLSSTRYNKPTPMQSSGAPNIPSVKGLSAKVVHRLKEPVGPGASKNSNYKNPEYFCYDKDSFFEAEVEMASYRCPQPSSVKK